MSQGKAVQAANPNNPNNPNTDLVPNNPNTDLVLEIAKFAFPTPRFRVEIGTYTHSVELHGFLIRVRAGAGPGLRRGMREGGVGVALWRVLQLSLRECRRTVLGLGRQCRRV